MGSRFRGNDEEGRIPSLRVSAPPREPGRRAFMVMGGAGMQMADCDWVEQAAAWPELGRWLSDDAAERLGQIGRAHV